MMMRSMIGAAIGTIGCALLALGAHADPLKIRIGYQASPEKLIPMKLARTDIVPHLGKSYTVDFVLFQASSVEVTALATEDIDIATLGYSSFAIALDGAKMEDLRLVADGYRDGVAGAYSNDFMVKKDGPIHAVEDLKGKVLASNGAGSVVDIAMRYMMKKHGLEDKRDYTLIEASLPNMLPMLIQGKADLVTMNAIYTHNPKTAEAATTLFKERDALGVTEFAFYCARTGFLQRNGTALADFFEDMVRATRWMLASQNRADATQMLAEITKQSPDILSTYYLLPGEDVYRDPDAKPDTEALQRNVDAMVELGFIKSHIDVAKHADLSFITAAAGRLNQPGSAKTP
ncbi:MAG TPA: ABC transporter substrate-binding protein [Stellaceae bacterium]|nr:ABC transporter substrate-binding protein [Stellaceae bacterium]